MLSFAFSLLVTVFVVRWAWVEIEPLLPLLVGGLVIYGYFKWQHHR